ncbi:hypothetical protein [Gloeothece verrucosa]|uniref:hypothetical protein n=1 Tax=Gloeothece verrucosa TaxID=2546359 RepID=UPI00031A7651|nr:hypothetical protein [Gloeothece verrucosa]
MCVSDEGIPFGLIHQKVWATSHKNHKKDRFLIPLKDKESYRWVESLKLSDDYLFLYERFVITMTDREGDIYDLLATERDWGSELLIRGHHNRRVKKNIEDKETSSLWQEIRSSSPGGDFTITLRRVSSHDDREATLTLRWKKLGSIPFL